MPNIFIDTKENTSCSDNNQQQLLGSYCGWAFFQVLSSQVTVGTIVPITDPGKPSHKR